MVKGIDCATPLTAKTAQAIAAEGYEFVARYLVPETYNKYLSKAEAQFISDSGMNIVSVFETTASRPLGGDAAGRGDAQLALNCARKIGQPKGTAIYFCADFDLTKPSHFDLTENYLRAATVVLGNEYEVGIYGEFSVIEEMAKRNACKHFWQTYAWSKGQKSSRANLYQWRNGQSVGGVAVDLNESYGNEGWWSFRPADPSCVTIRLNGKKVAEGKLVDGVTFVPLRSLCGALGASVEWNDKSKTANIIT